MKARKFVKTLLLVSSVVALGAAPPKELTPGVPTIFNPNESLFQQQTHFLVFTGSDTAGENATTARAYYAAIDPTNSKQDFPHWLLNAGFISDVNQWHPTGKQLIACSFANCDLPAGTYGDNVINTDSHAIVLNAADLGFVRNQFIRCVPSCAAQNPIIYTYLENYPVNPFAEHQKGGSGFPIFTGYPTKAEAAAAIQSAINRPLGNLAGCTSTDTFLNCSVARIADVAFEWAPPATNPASSTRFGQLYAYLFQDNGVNGTSETLNIPAGSGVIGKTTPNVATGALNLINAGDPFPPNLDFLGFKQHPGVCLVCHGGGPSRLTQAGAYPNHGNIDGFRFLPLDVRNLIFTSDSGPESTSRLSQEPQLKAYNLAVLKTVSTHLERDDQGVLRVPHLAEVIQGWYAANSSIQKLDFTPVGWREPANGGTAPPNSEHLYQTVLSPSCRSCHFNRELSLDFGTARNFVAERDNVLELVLQPYCDVRHPNPGNRPMALAHLTYQRFWQANAVAQTLPSGEPVLTLMNTADQIANYFGYASTAAYCSSQR